MFPNLFLISSLSIGELVKEIVEEEEERLWNEHLQLIIITPQ